MAADLRQPSGTGVPSVISYSHRRDGRIVSSWQRGATEVGRDSVEPSRKRTKTRLDGVSPHRHARATALSLQSGLLTIVALLSLTSIALASGDLDLPGLHNFRRATTNVFSGAQPEGAAAFAALARLGAKTILSVDGAKPDVALAAKHGLRYVHLPIGYDGIASNRVVELAQAAVTLPGPIFVHCHHGLHRGPAAVGILCRAGAGWSADEAEQFMKRAGTAPEYAGLYRTVREFTPPTPAQLAAVGADFPAVAKTTPLVDTMVAIDAHFDRLKTADRAGWKPTPATASGGVAHEALLLLEQLRELARTDDTKQRPADYRAKLDAARAAAGTLHAQLTAGSPSADAFNRLRQSCTDCHRRYRNE